MPGNCMRGCLARGCELGGVEEQLVQAASAGEKHKLLGCGDDSASSKCRQAPCWKQNAQVQTTPADAAATAHFKAMHACMHERTATSGRCWTGAGDENQPDCCATERQPKRRSRASSPRCAAPLCALPQPRQAGPDSDATQQDCSEL